MTPSGAPQTEIHSKQFPAAIAVPKKDGVICAPLVEMARATFFCMVERNKYSGRCRIGVVFFLTLSAPTVKTRFAALGKAF
jgi:hypothetical protein